MDKRQLTELVIIPTLNEIRKGFSENAVMAILMIVAHESARGQYLKQIDGPALGLIGMEPPTHFDTWKHGDSIKPNAKFMGIKQDVNCLVYDLRYNVFMARQKLFMVKCALPSDPMEMARYLKVHWNGDGEATPAKYYNDYMSWR